MAVNYVPLDGESVSTLWAAPLTDARDDGVGYHVNEGHRTKGRQQELLNEKGLWSPANPHGAAAVSDKAPHIRTGRPDHANDVVSPSGLTNDRLGGARELATWLAKNGIVVRFTVPGEDWHMEAPLDDLERYWRRHPRGHGMHRREGDWFLADDERSWLHSYNHPRNRAQQVRARNRLRRRVVWLYAAWKAGKAARRPDKLHRGARQAYLRARVGRKKGKR